MAKETKESFELMKLKPENLVEYQGFEDQQKQLVEDNPYIEITDNASYEAAKKNRTALVKGRTGIEGQDKTVGTFISQFRKGTIALCNKLVDITKAAEDKQQAEVKRWEGILEEKRQEKKRQEEAAQQAIQEAISTAETSAQAIIDGMTYDNYLQSAIEMETIFETLLADNDLGDLLPIWSATQVRLTEAHSLKQSQVIADHQLEQRTAERLEEIKALGMVLVGTAQYGIPGVWSGLYIEILTNRTADEWEGYIGQVKEAIQRHADQLEEQQIQDRKNYLQEKKDEAQQYIDNMDIDNADLDHEDTFDKIFGLKKVAEDLFGGIESDEYAAALVVESSFHQKAMERSEAIKAQAVLGS